MQHPQDSSHPVEQPDALRVRFAEELVAASGRHARGEISDQEYLEIRSRLVDGLTDGGPAASAE